MEFKVGDIVTIDWDRFYIKNGGKFPGMNKSEVKKLSVNKGEERRIIAIAEDTSREYPITLDKPFGGVSIGDYALEELKLVRKGGR